MHYQLIEFDCQSVFLPSKVDGYRSYGAILCVATSIGGEGEKQQSFTKTFYFGSRLF